MSFPGAEGDRIQAGIRDTHRTREEGQKLLRECSDDFEKALAPVTATKEEASRD